MGFFRFCSFFERRTYGVQERSFTQTSIEKRYNQLFRVWRKFKDNHIMVTCVFFELALHLPGTQRPEEEVSNLISLFMNKMDGLSVNQFPGVGMNDILHIEIC